MACNLNFLFQFINYKILCRNLKIQALTNENTKLGGKMKELDEWKLKYAQLEQDHGTRGSDADTKINALKLELEKVNKKVSVFLIVFRLLTNTIKKSRNLMP